MIESKNKKINASNSCQNTPNCVNKKYLSDFNELLDKISSLVYFSDIELTKEIYDGLTKRFDGVPYDCTPMIFTSMFKIGVIVGQRKERQRK